MYEFGTRRPWRCAPGATKSTPRVAAALRHGENAGDVSSSWRERAHRVGDADREDVAGRYAGSARAGRVHVALEAVVAAGCHDHDAGLPGLLDRVGERVDPVVLRRVRAVGEVDDPDVQPVVVPVLDDPVDRGDDLADVGAAVGDADLEAARSARRAPCPR